MASRTSPMRTLVPRGGTSSLDSASNSRVQQQQPRGSSGQPQQLHTSSTGGNGNVAILWDIENCPVPGEVNAEDVAGNIRYALRDHPQIGVVTMFSAYGDFNHFPRKVREGCQRTGVNLIDVPNGKKNAADKAILVDMFLFALDNRPPSTIFLITGDVDFAPALHKLGQRGYMVVLVVPDGVGVSSALRAAGNYVWDWPSLCRGGLVHPQKYGQHRATNTGEAGTLGDASNPTSPGHAFQTTWVQPGDLSGLKRQFVKLLSLNGGKMALVRVPAEYNKQFGRPLYLAEYNASKLVNLIEKMKDSLSIKGEGGQKILHLTKPSSNSSQKYSAGLNRGSVPKGEKEKYVEKVEDPMDDGKLATFRDELQQLLVSWTWRIKLSDFLMLYKLRYSHDIDLSMFGVENLEALLEKVKDVAVIKEDPATKDAFLVGVNIRT
ncbi:unnamed protein product [Sphagnum jensenii]|uniref:HTH OST-type domain-containing protein n=1 Tax=Sphagnum jensenii TaxID=128206 RepID=A0ABP1BIL3_9BRYO